MSEHTLELLSDILRAMTTSLTFPAIFLCGMVLWRWSPKAWTALWKRQRDAADWLVLGVTTFVIGASLNMAYWGTYWWLQNSGNPLYGTLNDYGPYVNLFTRQGMAVISCLCHLRAYRVHTEKRSPYLIYLWASLVAVTLFSTLQLLENMRG